MIMASKHASGSSTTTSCAISELNSKEVEVQSWVRGYHVYKDSWEIEIGEVLNLQHEPKNQQDKNAVAVVKNGKVVGHVPRALASTKQGSTADVKTVAKAVNRVGGDGMEVPFIYRFTGQQKFIKLLKSCRELASKAPDSKDILVKSFLYLISYSRDRIHKHSLTFTQASF